MFKQLPLASIAIAASLSLTACNLEISVDENEGTEQPQQPTQPVEKIVTTGAVIQTVAPDYANSQVAKVEYDASTGSYSLTDGYLLKDDSDYNVSTYMEQVFHIGRNDIDTITFHSADALDVTSLSVSTNLAGEVASANAYKVVVLNQDKGYVIRYGAEEILVVDPTPSSAADFVTGTIDLSAYTFAGSEDLSPQAADAVVVDGKLFVVMQRMLIVAGSWTPNTPYLAVIDTATDTEIETNADDSDSLKGIPLNGINPLSDPLYAFNGSVYVSTSGWWSNSDVSISKLEKVDTTTYALSEVLTAADLPNDAGQKIDRAVVIDDDKGYIYASSGWPTVSTLYEFNPSNGAIVNTDVALTAANGEGIAAIAVDNNQQLWLSINSATNPGIDIIDTNDNSAVTNRLPTVMNPGRIAFIEELVTE